MCDPITLAVSAMAAGSVLQAGSSIVQGEQEQKLANARAEMTDRQAAQERDAAVAQAEKFRRAGKRQASAADAAYAASGVSVGVGSPVRINEEIQRDAEEDAYMNILTGKRRGDTLETESRLSRQAGRNAKAAGNMGAVSSLLSGAGSIAGAWGGGGGSSFTNAGGGKAITAFDVKSRF